MAKALNAAELRGLSREALEKQVVELKEELFTLRFQAATGQLESHGRLRAVRKDIARIYTVIQERNLGIVSDPDTAEPETPGTPETSGTMASASEKA
ncbi:50S ribosomal protein L29 [Desertihabitans brevis]|uniref:Large ribosomal subunit protein uL29 n=1 Tax=Desertihabitans brevis TaxID=2268447 RepID=A0A367YXT3_9ACTN|nr:50S ribosomal protein L29 [Desertihabitans brevis]RCK69751.1 50S ribosomal protein L29 [Desertihabitans brevis]